MQPLVGKQVGCNACSWIVILILSFPAFAADTPEDLLKKARQLEKRGKSAQAAKIYKQFLKDYPEHTQILDVHYRLSDCLDRQGLIDDALNHLKIVVSAKDKRFKNRRDALFKLGKMQGSIKDYQNAVKNLELLLAEGAGLHEEEALNLSGGYHAILKKFDDAAAKFNILKRKENSRFAEQAAYKLAMLWIRSEKLERAVTAVEELVKGFPRNKQASGLMVQIADLCRRKKQYKQAVGVCEQLKTKYVNSREALAGGYVLGLCWRDQKQYQKAVDSLEKLARSPEYRQEGLAVEALLEAANILRNNLGKVPEAMDRYEETAKLAVSSNSGRKDKIRETCYFILGEHYFKAKKWAVALEYYLLLRKLGSEINILGRILKCQQELDAQNTGVDTPSDVEAIQKKIEDNKGTFAAAEAEIFLIDRELAAMRKSRRRRTFQKIVEKYEDVLKRYPKKIVSQYNLESYIHMQIGICHVEEKTKEHYAKAVTSFETSLSVDAKTPYKIPVLEHLAFAADQLEDNQKSFNAYKKLFELTAGKIKGGQDKKTLEQTKGYLKSLLTRAERKDSVTQAMELAEKIAADKGQFSPMAREARFYIGELYFLKKNFSAAAKSFRTFIKQYGPKQDAKGEIVGAPWDPGRELNDQTLQVFEASVRIAHAWYLQGHSQNMIKAYEWIVRNLSVKNRWMAEAEYWLALELIKGKKAEDKKAKRAAAERFWTRVVNPTYDFEGKDFRRNFHFWVGERHTHKDVEKYVKHAVMKAGQLFSEVKEHEKAAGIFKCYLNLFPPPATNRRPDLDKSDDMYRIARYALGREYLALNDMSKMVETYKPYTLALREDKFRVSALKLMGFHAGAADMTEEAVFAYATLLDEYGENKKDKEGKPIPIHRNEWMRKKWTKWDGIRIPIPKGLDLGEVRFSLGFLYWRREEWPQCIQALKSFQTDEELKTNSSRARALYMVAQSWIKLAKYKEGIKLIKVLIAEYPKYKAIDEAYVVAARGMVELKLWKDLDKLYADYIKKHPTGDRRPYMDLHAALSHLGMGRKLKGESILKGLANGNTYEDVKADAWFHLARLALNAKPPQLEKALENYKKSTDMYARDLSCFEAAECAVQLKKWGEAEKFLQRTIRAFPNGDRRIIHAAHKLLPKVLKEKALEKKRKKEGG